MTDLTLSSAQRILLQRVAAAGSDGFEIAPRARTSAAILVGHGLLEGADDLYRATPAGRQALGLAEEAEPLTAAEPEVPAADQQEPPTSRPPREGTKAAQVVEMLRQQDGVTVSRISEATGWLPHSVRGFLAGALKKTHGMAAVSEAAEGGRVYRLAPGGAQ
ncbi:MAG: DUF3489 domain-containing protein [Brevundimonas sp.]|uniref:DUF3489 domain-containing protein n=1 Tax=Brevundimonas sp. TaxID=1871086 RepID=UPI00391EF0B6